MGDPEAVGDLPHRVGRVEVRRDAVVVARVVVEQLLDRDRVVVGDVARVRDPELGERVVTRFQGSGVVERLHRRLAEHLAAAGEQEAIARLRRPVARLGPRVPTVEDGRPVLEDRHLRRADRLLLHEGLGQLVDLVGRRPPPDRWRSTAVPRARRSWRTRQHSGCYRRCRRPARRSGSGPPSSGCRTRSGNRLRSGRGGRTSRRRRRRCTPSSTCGRPTGRRTPGATR